VLASGADGAASEDGAGQNNAIWSEGPWGRAAAAARTEVLQRATSPGTERGSDEGSGEHEGQWQTVRREEASNGKALSDLPALKPYWGKPAVRNFREGNGNVGIMRSPLRAFALPDQSSACLVFCGCSKAYDAKVFLVPHFCAPSGSQTIAAGSTRPPNGMTGMWTAFQQDRTRSHSV
jgi:hypothetical protein